MSLRRRHPNRIAALDLTPESAVPAEPAPPRRPKGYRFARCGTALRAEPGGAGGCGWFQACEPHEAAGLLRSHVEECQFEVRALLVPMWSIAWPWLNGPSDAPFGLEMTWRVVGSQSTRDPHGIIAMTGMEAKPWYLFPLDDPDA